MPEEGTTEPSVRFFVNVAAEAFTFESDIPDLSFPLSILSDFTGGTGVHVAHLIVKSFLFKTGRTQIRTGAADGFFRLVVCASELTGRANVNTATAQTADIRLDVKRCSNAPVLASTAKTDGLGHHLFLTHPHAQAAQDTVLMLLSEPLLPDAMGRG
jgi:hypothetical protein